MLNALISYGVDDKLEFLVEAGAFVNRSRSMAEEDAAP
jgi:hypothetical protein